jgi:hypothetical protein
MSLLIRKINKAKWYQVDIENDSDVSADAITNCLKTTKNTLSVWCISCEEDLDNAVLALVSNQDNLETIDIVILEESLLDGYNIRIVATQGETPIEELAKTHRDIADLTFSKIGIIKDHIVERIRTKHLRRYTKGTLKKLIKDAIEDGKLKLEDLKESVQKNI